jgi:dephospho-CoA kinase
MLRVGLTGGLASGKSFVGKVLGDLGCHVIHADELGHQVLLKGGSVYDSVVREFGETILNEDKSINRRKLAAIVFADAGRLKVLNSFVHPVVIRMEEDLINEAASVDADAIAVVEAAILIETGSYKRFHTIILAVCSEEEQIRRAMHRDRITEEEARVRLSRQMSLAEKRKYATFIIDTSGAKEDTVAQTQAVYEQLRSMRI